MSLGVRTWGVLVGQGLKVLRPYAACGIVAGSDVKWNRDGERHNTASDSLYPEIQVFLLLLLILL